MATKTEIVNASLAILGANGVTNITSDNTETARKANAVYDFCLREVLSAGQWSFAIKRVELSVLSTAPEFDFAYQYTLPSDCIKVIKTSNDPNPYAIEGQNLLTDDDEVSIKYIAYISDTAYYTTPFITSLTTYIAATLCFSLTGKADLAQVLMQQYKNTLEDAKTKDSQQGTPEEQQLSEWFTERDNA